MADAGELVSGLRFGGEPYRVRPAPAPLSRLKGEYRAQLFIKGSTRPAMRRGAAGRSRADRKSVAERSSTSIQCPSLDLLV